MKYGMIILIAVLLASAGISLGKKGIENTQKAKTDRNIVMMQVMAEIK